MPTLVQWTTWALAWSQSPVPHSSGAEVSEAPRVERSDDKVHARDIEVEAKDQAPEHSERSASVVTREEIERRLPRSTPDAMRYEPGVYVQQTAHAQASPYIRGLTGQQTVMQFDGIRLNNSTFRQGPNQYFFLVDSRTVHRLEIMRGAASTLYGSDALGGVMLATPVGPTFDAQRRFALHPTLYLAGRTADREWGGRAELDMAWRDKVGFRGGVGYRKVGQLRTAGPIIEPSTGRPYLSPRFESDRQTQRGTGFDEFTADARLVAQSSDRHRWTLAYYDYRQKNAPRTDRCPADEAPEDSCEIYLDQFRTLTYAALDVEDGPGWAQNQRIAASFQRQREHRFLFSDNGIPEVSGGVENNGSDIVNTFGVTWKLRTRALAFGRQKAWSLQFDYGADLYFDHVTSLAWQKFTDYDPPEVRFFSRGQYLDDARYASAGLFVAARLIIGGNWRARVGGRLASAHARAAGDPATQSSAVDRDWIQPIGSAGLEWWPSAWFSSFIGVDQGYRAPNLDDLTSRQQTGPGYQFENAELDPERALSFEWGAKLLHEVITAELSLFQTNLRDAIVRAPRDVCPTDLDGCSASRTRFQLVNARGRAWVRGVEASARLVTPIGIHATTTLSYAIGEAPDPVFDGDRAAADLAPRQPISRVPPLNGSVELGWRSPFGLWLGAALRWAGAQTRLAPADVADIRIPGGGTPGFAVVDLHAGYQWRRYLRAALVFENVGNTRYRYHGSSVNGAARSLSGQLVLGF